MKTGFALEIGTIDRRCGSAGASPSRLPVLKRLHGIYTSDYCKNHPEINLPCAVSTTTEPTMFASRSRHTGGVQLVLGDGSCRFVSENINLVTWRNLASSRDGQVISEF